MGVDVDGELQDGEYNEEQRRKGQGCLDERLALLATFPGDGRSFNPPQTPRCYNPCKRLTSRLKIPLTPPVST